MTQLKPATVARQGAYAEAVARFRDHAGNLIPGEEEEFRQELDTVIHLIRYGYATAATKRAHMAIARHVQKDHVCNAIEEISAVQMLLFGELLWSEPGDAGL